MRNRIINIFVLFVLCLVHSCIEKESFEPVQSQTNGTVVFSATPKGFTTANVGTKADGDESDEGFDPNVFENTIYNAFFLLFDNNGLLRVKGIATVNEDHNTVTYDIGRDAFSVFPKFTIAFLANVPKSAYDSDFVVGTTSLTSLQSHYLKVSYAPFSETGSVGVPQKADLDGDGTEEYALPMFKSKEFSAPYNAATDYSIMLERMFARVEVMVSLGIQDDGSLATSTPQFSMVECDFHNIPTLVPLMRQTGSTACSDVPDSEAGTKLFDEPGVSAYNLSTEDSKILYYSPASDPVYRSLYCYIPEHKFGGDRGSNTVQANKPTLVSGTQRPAYISISGYIVNRVGTSYDAKYNIYFGENATNNFDLSRNTIYKNYVRINGVNSADHRVEKMEEVKVVINDVTRRGMAANCYIISTEGTYLLPAYRGAYNNMATAQMCELGTNRVIACDNPAISITFDENLSKQSTIVFNVDNTGLNLLSGNAVIGRYKPTGELDWSWHLWFIPGAELGEGSNDLGEPNRIGGLLTADLYDGTIMADRNLGVNASLTDVTTWLPPTIIGTYYKYGHRNPYFEDKKYGHGTAYHGINSNDYESWGGNTKSKTDPCPPGYRVPAQSVWEGTNAQNSTNEHYSGLLGIQVSAFRYWDSGTNGLLGGLDEALYITDDIYYPYGYMTSSGVVNKTTKELDFTMKNNMTVTSDEKEVRSWQEGGILNRVYYREMQVTETTYTNIRYKAPSVSANIGELLTQSNASTFQFFASSSTVSWNNFHDTIRFLSCTKKVVTKTQLQRRGILTGWTNSGEPTINQSSEGTSTEEPSADWRSQAANEVIGSKSLLNQNPSKALGTSGIISEAPNPNYGYQVRCVQER